MIFGLSVFIAGSVVVVEDITALQVEFDEDVPPGNPVVGSDAPGDTEDTGPNYGLLALIALGLIAAGAAFIKLEAWERRRSAEDSTRL